MTLEEIKKMNKADLSGKIICFSTDTVVGLGCMIDDNIALEKIYNLKHRDNKKPLAILVPNSDCVKEFVDDVPFKAQEMMEKHWPGALTIIFKKKTNEYDLLTRGLSTIGLRMPNSKIALTVLNQFGPMATTSVNISGNPPINDIDEIKELFKDKIDYYVTEKEEHIGVSSTVVDLTNNQCKILRQGSIIID